MMVSEAKKFYKIIRTLKFIKRQGWKGRHLNADTIAAHVYGAIGLGWFLADEEKADKQRTMEMLLVHDFVMAEMEDVSPTIGRYSGRYKDKRQMELKANTLVLESIPSNLREDYLALIKEYNDKFTKESIIANEANKLETLLQGETYEMKMGRNDIIDEFLQTYSNIFQTESGKKLFEEIITRHEERKRNG